MAHRLKSVRNYFFSFLKKILMSVGDVVSSVFSTKRHLSGITDIYIFFPESLGIGDHIMLTPAICKLTTHFKEKNIFICSRWPRFINIDGVGWWSHEDFDKLKKTSSLLICPDYSPLNILLIGKCKYIVGYIFGPKIYSNFCGPGLSFCHQHDPYFHRFENILEVLDVKEVDVRPSAFSFNQGNLKLAEGHGEFICVSPFSRWPERQYDLIKLKLALQDLSERFEIIFVGGEEDQASLLESSELFSGLSYTSYMNTISFDDTCGLIAASRAYIGNDTGLSHVASYLAPSAVLIFGCCNPETRLTRHLLKQDRLKILSNGTCCEFYPCFDGLGKPSCKNTEKFICLDIEHSKITAAIVE